MELKYRVVLDELWDSVPRKNSNFWDGFADTLETIEKVIIKNDDVEKCLQGLEEKYTHPDADEYYQGAKEAVEMFRGELKKYEPKN